MKSGKKSFVTGCLLLTTLLFSCGNQGSSSMTSQGDSTSLEPTTSIGESTSSLEPTTSLEPSTSIEPTTSVAPSTSSLPKDYYGKVQFDNIYVSGGGYDNVLIRPILTKPEVCENEVFEYEVEDESICMVEDDRVIFVSEGSTLVTAKSDHLKGSFYVYTKNNFDFYTQANAQANRMKQYQEGDTLFLGDSFFEFWRNSTNIDKTMAFDQVFCDYKVFNIGISATTTHDWRSMLDRVVSKAINPKNIVINMGINNVDDDKESGKLCARNLQAMIQDYLELFPETHVYYLSITRCSGYFSFNWESHEASNQIMETYCNNQERVHYLDVMALYGDNYANYQQDGLHPNTEGYKLFEKIIKENVPLDAKKSN